MDRRSDISPGNEARRTLPPASARCPVDESAPGSAIVNPLPVVRSPENHLPPTEPETLGARILRLAEVAAILHLGQGMLRELPGENSS